jgi:hypothetical protein
LENNKNEINLSGLTVNSLKLDSNFGDLDMNFVIQVLQKGHTIYSIDLSSKIIPKINFKKITSRTKEFPFCVKSSKKMKL